MSLTYVSPKKPGRVYHRAFDHDEAQVLRAEDPKTWTIKALAEKYAVSETAISRVLYPRVNARMEAHSRRWMEARRKPCKGGCGTLTWDIRGKRTGYCLTCVGAFRASGDIREDTLRCRTCGEWKPDSEFYRQTRAIARRGRVRECKPCANATRREYRHRNREAEADYSNRRYRDKRERNSMTTFIVFQPNGKGFVEVERVEAASAEHAVEKAATGPGEYVAVTESRFKVMTVAPIESLRVVKNPLPDA